MKFKFLNCIFLIFFIFGGVLYSDEKRQVEEKEVEIAPLTVDINTFEHIDNRYYKDKTNIYYNKNGKLKNIEDIK